MSGVVHYTKVGQWRPRKRAICAEPQRCKTEGRIPAVVLQHPRNDPTETKEGLAGILVLAITHLVHKFIHCLAERAPPFAAGPALAKQLLIDLPTLPFYPTLPPPLLSMRTNKIHSCVAPIRGGFERQIRPEERQYCSRLWDNRT